MITIISLILVILVTVFQWRGQWRFVQRSKKVIELQRKYLANEMEMCRLRDSLVLSIEQNDWETFALTNSLLSEKIRESRIILNSIKDVTESY